MVDVLGVKVSKDEIKKRKNLATKQYISASSPVGATGLGAAGAVPGLVGAVTGIAEGGSAGVGAGTGAVGPASSFADVLEGGGVAGKQQEGFVLAWSNDRQGGTFNYTVELWDLLGCR